MSAPAEPAKVSIRILDKDYFIACPQEERSALLDAAEFLNTRMREVRDGGKIMGLDRVAVMVALNLANELLQLKHRDVKAENEVVKRVHAVRERIEKAISQSRQLEF
jgi:cell division protein ZapA